MIRHRKLPAAILPILLTPPQAAKMLSVSPATLKRMRAEGTLPEPVLERASRCVRYSRVELEAWTVAGCPSRAAWRRERERSIALLVKPSRS
jgi:predicted DNA-binding transcriptional regulator AlpA